ncbi:NADAR family protein [Brevibacillus reuszeri]|uniref:NADAR family protein n=1 Tax=Brevibacillus reuszeri TaxID=54915 RepID=UPI00289DACEF|nr:NADAR family protein [Brevibacillus reuszeri]
MELIQDVQMLIKASNHTRLKYVFFWGNTQKNADVIDKTCFSQWYPAAFFEDETTYRTAEHYMMAKKAELFGDLTIRDEILKAGHPKQAKALGRRVHSFHEGVWDENKTSIVRRANLLKFSQHPDLLEYLLGTGDRIIVEASPYDRVWGIGMAQDHPHAEQPERWRGENLLGFALMAVRAQLRTRA